MKAFLETARLKLREFVSADADALFALDSDPEVMRYLTGGAATPFETIRDVILPGFMASHQKFDGPGYWAAEELETGAFVGWFGLHPADPPTSGELELGYRIRKEYWGKGFATEGSLSLIEAAFNRGVSRVIAQTYEENRASRRVMEKLGMELARSFRIESADQLKGPTFDASEAPLFDGEDVEYAIDRERWLRANTVAKPTTPGRLRR